LAVDGAVVEGCRRGRVEADGGQSVEPVGGGADLGAEPHAHYPNRRAADCGFSR